MAERDTKKTKTVSHWANRPPRPESAGFEQRRKLWEALSAYIRPCTNSHCAQQQHKNEAAMRGGAGGLRLDKGWFRGLAGCPCHL